MTSVIVDQRGKPFPRTANVRASFDLAKTNAHNRRHWANADSLSARAAMSPAVRALVRQRSRYEFDNNSWYSGILRTAANHIIGCAPVRLLNWRDRKNCGRSPASIRRFWRPQSGKTGTRQRPKTLSSKKKPKHGRRRPATEVGYRTPRRRYWKQPFA